MSRFDGIRHRLRVVWRGERYAEEQAREIALHVELETQARRRTREQADIGAPAHGLGADQEARRAIGNVTYYREEARRMTLLHWRDRFRQDVGYALRGMRRAPGFTAIIVVTLALGFGVNGAMFSMLHTLFLRVPDGVQAPAELRRLYSKTHPRGTPSRVNTSDVFAYPVARAIAHDAAPREIGISLRADSVRAELDKARFSVRADEVSRSYFSVLGARTVIGRTFVGEEDSIGTPRFVAVISEALWRTRFGGRTDVLGRTLVLNHRPFTVIGVAAGNFRGVDLGVVDVWVPINTHETEPESGPAWYDGSATPAQLVVRAPTKSDVTRWTGIAELALRNTTIGPRRPDVNALVVVGPLNSALGPIDHEPEFDVAKRIAAVALIVLVIASTNAINLLLLRGANRRREIALRRALGVSNRRLAAQLIVESVLLSAIAGVTAAAVAQLSGAALRHLVLPETQLAHGALDLTTLVAIAAMSLSIGLLAGVAPARQGLRVDLIDSLRAGAHGSGYQRSRLRSMLLVVQTALCVVLVVGASLFLRSLANARAIDVGYDVTNSTMFEPVFPQGGGKHDVAQVRGMAEVERRIEHLPGVRTVAIAQGSPMLSIEFVTAFLPGGAPLPRSADGIPPTMNSVSSTFFDAVGMRVLKGRRFGAQDTPGATRTIIVSETMADVVWPGEDPVGKCLLVGGPTAPCATVVGVVSDAHRISLIEGRSMIWYTSLTQPFPQSSAPASLIVRTNEGQAQRVAAIVERELNAAIPGLDGIDVKRLGDVVERQLRPWQLGAALFVAFGALSLVVAGIGVYSVAAFAVSQRTREMGVRMALGAQRREIVDLVVGDGLRTVAIGIAIGIVSALMLGRLVRTILFGVTSSDPSALIIAAIALCVLGTFASLLPALRASRVDPAVALQSD